MNGGRVPVPASNAGASTQQRPLAAATLDDSQISMSLVTEDMPYRLRRRLRHTSITEITLYDQVASCIASINAEPLLMLFSMTFGIILTMQTLFLYWARCVELFTTSAIDGNGTTSQNISMLCTEISNANNTHFLDIVEGDIAYYRIFLQAINTVTTVISAPIIGTISDGPAGRKKPLMFCLMGSVVYCGLQVAAVTFYEKINVYVFMFVGEFLSGLVGGMSSVFTLSMSIITDDCRREHSIEHSGIPLRIAIAGACQQIGILLGTLIVMVLSVPASVNTFQHVEGYYRMTMSAFILSLVTFLYAIICLNDTYRPPSVDAQVDFAEGQSPRRSTTRTRLQTAKRFVYEVFEVMLQPRPGHTRLCLNLCIVFIFTDILANDGNLLALFVKRAPFMWTDSKFTAFLLSRNILGTIGMVIIPIIFSHLNIMAADSWMVIIGLIFSIIVAMMLAFASSSAVIFATALFTMVGQCIGIGYRTLLPKMVSQDQTARLFSFVSMVFVVCPLFSNIVFNNVYTATMDTWAGFVFFIFAGVHFLVLIGQMVVHRLMLPIWSKDNTTNAAAAAAAAAGDSTYRPLLQEEDSEDSQESDGQQPQQPRRPSLASDVAVTSGDEGHGHFF